MFETAKTEERECAIENVIKAEWEMFQKVQNIGGRASCQDDWTTFHIMRYSQFSAWTDEMLVSYSRDLKRAEAVGRNLLAEKYAYMMEITAPEYYVKELKPKLPEVDLAAMDMVEEITWYLVECEKEFALQFPKLSRSGRPILAGTETGGFASVETYALGELKTFSKETLKRYLDHVRLNRASGKNIAMEIQDTMVKLYGYTDVEDAENRV